MADYFEILENDEATEEHTSELLEFNKDKKLNILPINVKSEHTIKLFNHPSTNQLKPKILTLKLDLFDEDKKPIDNLFDV